MNKIILKIIKFYGNSGWKLDFLISILLTYFIIKASIIDNFNFDNLINFFSILIGFLLTTFSFLYSVQPSNNTNLSKIRTGKTYKKMLYSILTSSFILTMTVLLIILNFQKIENIILFMVLFSILRFFKTLFFLYYILIIEN